MVATLPLIEPIEAMAEAMRDAGLPKDQTERFILGGYVPLPGMLPFHRFAREADRQGGPQDIALGGKRGPGKSHTIFAQVALDDCQRTSGLKALFLRKIQRAATESLADVLGRVLSYTPHTLTSDGVVFPNGSRILIGGFKDDKDIDKYLGIEYDIIVVEEATQLTAGKIEKLRGSRRSSKVSWRPRMYYSTNADGVGLQWFKREFVEPARNHTEKDTRFLDVTGIHNPFINSEYNEWLDALTGPLRKAWRDGDWDAFAGQAFPQWNHERHIVEPFDLPEHWIKWRATDWGFASPFCTLWFAKNPDTRRVYAYRELYGAGMTDRQQARAIQDMTLPGEVIRVHYADPSLWEKKNYEGRVFSTADEYQAEGIRLTRGDNDRLGGKRKVNNILADLADGEPGLVLFRDCCPHLAEQLAGLACDPNRPEDVDTDAEDHAYDTLRYGLTNERQVEQPAAPRHNNRHPMTGVKGL